MIGGIVSFGVAHNLGLGTWPHRRARIDPGSVALSQGPRSLTYGELEDRVARLAAGLTSLGVRPGDRVAYVGLNDLSTFETIFAAGWAGAIAVPVNHRLAPVEVDLLLADADARVLVVGRGVEELIEGWRGLHTRAWTGHLVQVAAESLPGLGTSIPYNDLLAFERAEAVPVDVRDPAVLLYTSGTTGRPKGAMLTHENLTWNTMNQLAHVDVMSTDRALCLAPLFHAVGLGQVTLPVLFKGGTVEVVPSFDAGSILRLVEELQVASFSCVPTMLQLMVEHPDWERRDLSSLRHVIYGGSPATERVSLAWLRRGVTIQQGYGMTEASPGVTMAMPWATRDKPTSVGVPHFFTDVAARGEDGLPTQPVVGRPDELLVRGPHVFSGYWRRPEATAESLADGWYRTGDVVVVDDQGWSRVVDRVKDLIISGGENVYPAEIEHVLAAVPGVRSAAMVGRPDDRWGEVGVVFVERSHDAAGRSLDEAVLLANLEGRLARFKLPRQVVLVDDLPRTATGKILRADLRERAATPHPADQPSAQEQP